MSNAADLTTGALGGTFPFGGITNNYSSVDTHTFQGNVFANYGGLANNFQNQVASNTINAAADQPYTGYSISFSAALASPPTPNPNPNDNQQVISWPKNQQIYYKLVGFNTNTSTFETWIIAEEIVPRPETFDPTGNFPNVEYGVFFTPPSGNKLVNIKIVGRWIQ